MRVKAIHYNPPGASGKARCGKKLADVEHRSDPADATCNVCVALIRRDADAPRRVAADAVSTSIYGTSQ